ncbi:MAG: TonB-dependent receptor [Pseudomonadota bacterium]
MFRMMNGVSALAISTVFSMSPALAQTAADPAPATDDRRLQAITVTATKRAESAQDVPVAVSAIGEQQLDQLGVDVFTDYLTQLPGVTAGGAGPGQNTIYIRGVASTTPNLTTAGVAGLAPNVAFYLDEQPLAQPGRNLDVYAADLQRIEVLPGPQGTLFGASSQAGTVRLITNKPVLGAFEANFKAGTAFTEGGENSNNVEAVLNLPVTDQFALRGVVYSDNQGGYIDNVPGVRDASESARFRPEGTVRANGVPVSAPRAGFQAGADLSNVTFLEANNAGLVEKNFNDTTYSGYRLSGLYEFNPDWRLTVGLAQQSIESDGVFFSDPELDDDWEIQRFEADNIEDSFTNVSWTLEGQLGALEAVYTGAFTDRDTEQRVDYSDYLFVGQYLPYYICDGSVSYPGDAGPVGTCQPPNLFVDSRTQTEVFTQEIRFTTPSENRLRATFGAFYSDLELTELNDFTYPGSERAISFNGTPGFGPNFALTNVDATGAVGDAAPGFFSDASPFPEGVIFRNDIRRTDEQVGVFGEVTYDLVPDMFAVTLGGRWYDIEVDLEGSANSSFGNFGATEDAQVFGTNISAIYAPGNAFGNPDTAATDGVITKATLEWTPSSDLLFFATYSEGFRAGLLNRPGGRVSPTGFVVPFEVDTDEVTNYELGWKTLLLDGQLRFNGSAFFVEVEGLQTTILDPSIVNLFFSANAADAEVMGLEGDFTYAPAALSGLTLAGAFSILDTEITDVLIPTGDVIEGDSLAFAPEFQGNLRARYEWPVTFAGETYDAHVMPQVVYSSEATTDIITINSTDLDAWTTVAISAGVAKDNWTLELYGENLTNEAAEVSGTFINDRDRITLARPRTIGVRVGVDF